MLQHALRGFGMLEVNVGIFEIFVINKARDHHQRVIEKEAAAVALPKKGASIYQPH